MATQGGLGLVLKINTGSLTAVANLIEAEFPEQEKELWEYVLHSSADGYAEYMDTGLRKLSDFTATVLWDDTETTHAAMLTAFESTATVGMSIEDPAGQEVIAFNAHIQKIGRISKADEGYQAEIAIQPSGGPTIT